MCHHTRFCGSGASCLLEKHSRACITSSAQRKDFDLKSNKRQANDVKQESEAMFFFFFFLLYFNVQ